MLYFFSPFSFTKNLFEAYDAHMKLLPSAEDWGILMDLDVCFLTPDAPEVIQEVIDANPQVSLWSCLCNRIGTAVQNYESKPSYNPDIYYHIEIAEALKKKSRLDWCPVDHVISGMVMMIQKKTWDKIPPTTKLLGVDHWISQHVLDSGGKIGVMFGVYCWHTYRITKSQYDKTHLL